MAITSTGLNAAINKDVAPTQTTKDKTVLGKDDFMTLLLVELQNQDPTEPMDSEKILTQTSQLASLESAENTNKALEDLASSLGNSQQFSTISAIGKTADLGSNAIGHDKGSTTSFEIYFPDDVSSGMVEIVDSEGQIVSTIDIGENPSGVYQFDWDGTLSNGELADSSMYYVSASYNNPAGDSLKTRMGAYPIESIRFDGTDTLIKVGSNYVPIGQVKEIY
jgi:flagellar basal-body rod modification protein FlgD